jgi:polysaccharide biosynthesis transport protein
MITADGKLVNEQQIAELNSQLVVAHERTSKAKARLDRIDAVIRDDSFDTKTGPTVADTLNNPVITQLRTRFLETSNREANWSRKYGANHLAVLNYLGDGNLSISQRLLGYQGVSAFSHGHSDGPE